MIVVSPMIGGQAVKGPTAKIMGELGTAVTSRRHRRALPRADRRYRHRRTPMRRRPTRSPLEVRYYPNADARRRRQAPRSLARDDIRGLGSQRTAPRGGLTVREDFHCSWAIVPVKPLARAKAAAGVPARRARTRRRWRARCSRTFCGRYLVRARSAGTLVVTGDREVATIAQQCRRRRAGRHRATPDRSAASNQAAAHARGHGAARRCSSSLPTCRSLTWDDVDAIVHGHAARARDHHGTGQQPTSGTNALCLFAARTRSRRNSVKTASGRHCDAARRAGIEPPKVADAGRHRARRRSSGRPACLCVARPSVTHAYAVSRIKRDTRRLRIVAERRRERCLSRAMVP